MGERHYIVFQANGYESGIAKESGVGTMEAFSRFAAETFFKTIMEQPHVNWVKWFHIRDEDGAYLFNAEFQRRVVK